MGHLVVISSPSGTGKNTIINALLKDLPGATRFVTTTTRPMRPHERAGVDYLFISRAEFQTMISAGAFVEYNQYAEEWYGTERARLDETLTKFSLVFLVLDIHGKDNLTKLGIPHLAIFLLPESLEALADRIRHRGGTSEEKIAERLEIAKEEIASASRYDCQVVNADGKMGETVAEIKRILQDRGLIDGKTKS